jgi:predicted P-loop ATPase
MDELATLSKTEINSLKSIFSKINVKVRHPYGRKAITTPRRASFYGSTNNLEFLTDSTGSVRWLCFELTDKINWDYKNDFNIDDIWRQAYSLYLNGFDFELTPTEIKENEERNREFYVRTTEHELIDKYFSPGNSDNYTLFFTATDIQDYLSEAHPKLKFSSINIGKALKVLGFERVSKRTEHKTYPVKGYFLIKRE